MAKLIGVILGLGILLVGSVALAQEAEPQAQAGSSPYMLIVILVVFAAVFYFMLIRPQRKRQSQHNALLKDLKRGDNVVTAGGIYGEIDSVGDTSVVVTVEDGGKLKVAKSSIVDKRAK